MRMKNRNEYTKIKSFIKITKIIIKKYNRNR